MNLFVLNLILAFIWLLLGENPGGMRFIAGFILGFLTIAVFKPAFADTRYLKRRSGKGGDYVRRTLWFCYFIFWFGYQFLKSNLKIAWAVLTRPNSTIHPGIFTFNVKNLSTFEIIMLSQCITLTPGTITIKVEDDQNAIYVHAFHVEEVGSEREFLQHELVKNILRFTR